jgi:NADH:ubiquinone reductase (H+-translocating)
MRVGIAQTESLPKVAIVGGGFGGLIAARKLAGKRLSFNLIDHTNYHLF